MKNPIFHRCLTIFRFIGLKTCEALIRRMPLSAALTAFYISYSKYSFQYTHCMRANRFSTNESETRTANLNKRTRFRGPIYTLCISGQSAESANNS